MGLTVWVIEEGKKAEKENGREGMEIATALSILAYQHLSVPGYVCGISQFEDSGALEKLSIFLRCPIQPQVLGPGTTVAS